MERPRYSSNEPVCLPKRTRIANPSRPLRPLRHLPSSVAQVSSIPSLDLHRLGALTLSHSLARNENSKTRLSHPTPIHFSPL